MFILDVGWLSFGHFLKDVAAAAWPKTEGTPKNCCVLFLLWAVVKFYLSIISGDDASWSSGDWLLCC